MTTSGGGLVVVYGGEGIKGGYGRGISKGHGREVYVDPWTTMRWPAQYPEDLIQKDKLQNMLNHISFKKKFMLPASASQNLILTVIDQHQVDSQKPIYLFINHCSQSLVSASLNLIPDRHW